MQIQQKIHSEILIVLATLSWLFECDTQTFSVWSSLQPQPPPHPLKNTPSNSLFFVGILATIGSNSDGPSHFVSSVWTGHSDHPSLTTTSPFTSTILSRPDTITRKKCLLLLDLEARKSSLLQTCFVVSLCLPKSLTCWVCLCMWTISFLYCLTSPGWQWRLVVGVGPKMPVLCMLKCTAWRNSLQWFCIIKILHGGWLG